MRELRISGGWFFGGALLTLLSAARMGGLPWQLLLVIGGIGGVAACLPTLILLVLRLFRPQPASAECGAETLLLAFARSTFFLVGVGLLCDILVAVFAAVFHLGDALAPGQVAGWVATACIAPATLLAARAVSRTAIRLRIASSTIALAGLALLGALAFGLGAKPFRPREPVPVAVPVAHGVVPRMVVLAIDGLGAEMWEKYRDRMPHLAAFEKTASKGRLWAGEGVPTMSVNIWNSVTTGLPPSRSKLATFELAFDWPHFGALSVDGIGSDPLVGLALLPVTLAWRMGILHVALNTSLHREGTPFWNAKDFGRTGVVCWPSTWPADPLDGVLVSDRWPSWEELFHAGGGDAGIPAVFPSAFEKPLAPFRRSVKESPDEGVRQLADFLPEEIAAMTEAHDSSVTIGPRMVPMLTVYSVWQNDLSCIAAAHQVEETVDPEVLLLYVHGIDGLGHALLPDGQGNIPGMEKTAGRRLGVIFGNYMAHLDQELAWTLELGDAQTLHVVITDHGFEELAGSRLFTGLHAGDGMVMVQGPGFGPDRALGRRTPAEWYPLLAGTEH